MLNEFVSLLALFAEATTTTQAQDTPSISIVAPSILTIYDDLAREQASIKHATNLRECLLESILSRFGGLLEEMTVVTDIPEKKKNKRSYDLFKDPMILLAPFLDGRFRLRWISCSSLSDSAQEQLSNKIQQLVLEHCILLEHVNGHPATSPIDNTALNQVVQPHTTINNASASPTTPKRKCLFANMQNKETKKTKSDLFTYIKDDVDSMFLLKSSNNYSTLSKVASKVLSIPATSASVERTFSQSGFLFRQHRASMSRTTLQQLTMLKRNRDLI